MAKVEPSVPNALSPLAPLQKIAASFEAVLHVRSGAAAKALRDKTAREVILAGNACVPLLVRKLCGESDRQASWAFYLMAQLGGARVLRAVHERLRDAALADARKALLLALLSELGAPIPDDVVISDPDGLAEASVRELMASLTTDADFKQAADLIVAQVPVVDLPDFVDELVRDSGEPAVRLLEALLAHGQLPRQVEPHLGRLHAALATPPGGVRRPPALSRIRCRAVVEPRRSAHKPAPTRPRRRRPPSPNLDL